MHEDDSERESFEETIREIAREVSESVERAIEQVDLDGIAGAFGVDPAKAREWVDSAGGWLRVQVEHLGEDAANWGAPKQAAPREQSQSADRTARPAEQEDPLRHAGPHPLDLPSEEQGLALAALDSGRWTVEPGTDTLAARGEGPGPSDALGLVRELRARDWISADGAVTAVGHHALQRWIDSTKAR
jgi:hypothetical protein